MDRTYPGSHVKMIMGLNVLSFIVGLGILVGPFIKRWYPGSQDLTIHAGLGALIATLAFFRLALGHGSIWMDVVLAALGVITFMLPKFMHMQYNAPYNMAHLVGGAVVVGVAVVSMLATAAVLKKIKT